jgi:hypothetical protein
MLRVLFLSLFTSVTIFAYIPKYIWNLGIAQDCDVTPFKHTFPREYQTDPPLLSVNSMSYIKKVREGDVIWIQSSQLSRFVKFVLPRIKHRFTLVMSDGDQSFPSSHVRVTDIGKFLEDPRLIAVFAQNVDGTASHRKIKALPIGMDFHSMAKTAGAFAEPSYSALEQEAIMDDILSTLAPTSERKKSALIDFHLTDRRDLSINGKESRSYVANQVSSCVEKLSYMLPRHTLWRMKGQYAFSISPHGNGLDCHRTWEDLVLGCIVIVKTSSLDPLYEGLPVVIVTDWSEVTTENLDKWLLKYGDAFTNQKYRKRLMHDYWIERLRAAFYAQND